MMHSTAFSTDGSTTAAAGGNSMLDFDYRSLLPTRSSSASDSFSDAEDDECFLCTYFPELSWRERLIGCATCMIAGYILSMGSFWRIKSLVQGDAVPFVLNTTVGNLIALAGSFFLSGPRTQFQKMLHSVRRVATCLYLGSLFLTLLVTVTTGGAFLLIVLVLCQYVAITWYTLSYIPFARDVASGFMRRRMSGLI
ncbi:hypothetical protein MPSEU_000048100 [Mayamaea pseudoterrestris]|nr:hypothetical protein MPSEU_000048100 [Mayamaea pseudoterrestris]